MHDGNSCTNMTQQISTTPVKSAEYKVVLLQRLMLLKNEHDSLSK